MAQKILHKRSNQLENGAAKLPAASGLSYGEIAINYKAGNETIALKNDEDKVVSFNLSDAVWEKGTGENSVQQKGTGAVASGSCAVAEGSGTTAVGNFSHAEGIGATANNQRTHAEGFQSLAEGNTAHAEGYRGFAIGNFSHAEGASTHAVGNFSHSEGGNESYVVQLIGEGNSLIYSGTTEGGDSQELIDIYEKLGPTVFAQCLTNVNTYIPNNPYVASRILSFEILNRNDDILSFKIILDKSLSPSSVNGEARIGASGAWGRSSHSEGRGTKTVGENSHSEGRLTIALGNNSHTEGNHTFSSGDSSHAEGSNTIAAGNFSHAEGHSTSALTEYSHAEGQNTIASGNCAHAEGELAKALNTHAHAEGAYTTARGDASHAEGYSTTASGMGAHAEGMAAYAGGSFSHAEGQTTNAYGAYSHAEGNSSRAEKDNSHAEGFNTQAAGFYSHSEGQFTKTFGSASHVEGEYTIAKNESEHAEGHYNISNSATTTYGSSGNTQHSVGIGTSDSNRKNAFEIMQNGDAYLYGVGGYDGTNASANTSNTLQKVLEGAASSDELCWEPGIGLGSIQPKSRAGFVWEEAGGARPPVTIKEGAAGATRYLVSSPVTELADYYPVGTYFTIDKANVGAVVSYEPNPAMSMQWYMTVSNTLNPNSSLSNVSIGYYSYGNGTIPSYCSATGEYSYAEGYKTLASGNYTHAEGYATSATVLYTHAEGLNSKAIDIAAHAEGEGSQAFGRAAHAEGEGTRATAMYTHAEGCGTHAGGQYAHAEGVNTIAFPSASHAEGFESKTEEGVDGGIASHAEGYRTIAKYEGEHAEGTYNTTTILRSKRQRHSVGIGTSESDRKNAFTIFENGDTYLYGVGGYNGKNPQSASTLQQCINKMQEITWSALKSLRDSSGLTPGMQYRITDYNTTTVQADTQAAGHQFDIIVVADDNHTLNENARAVRHSGDTYFSGSTLEAWELKYDIDNDTTKFAWADSGSTGRGVIYWMKDEWNNECPYDFKNIKFYVPSTFEANQYNITHTYTKNGTVININDVNYYGYTRTRTGMGPPPPLPPEQLYVTETTLETDMGLYTVTDNVATVYTTATVDSVVNGDYEAYTFDSLGEDASMFLTNRCYSNTIGKFIYNNIQELNRIFIRRKSSSSGVYCYNNAFKPNCRHMIFGGGCSNNTFGNDCFGNTFGNYCEGNTFGGYFQNNTFGDYCQYNTFGIRCEGNTFGDYCQYNTFGIRCEYNTFGNSCQYNTFGKYCFYNTFGNSCKYNTFGNSCQYNTFGKYIRVLQFGNDVQYFITGNATGATTSAQTKDYIQYLIVENGVQNVNAYCTGATSSSNYCQNIKIGLGLKATSPSNRLQIDITQQIGATASVTYQPANSQVINI